MKAITTILSASMLLAACGGDSRIEQYQVSSYPGVHLEIFLYPIKFVPELSDQGDLTLRSGPCVEIKGFTPEWGTRYEISVRVSRSSPGGLDDNRCGEQGMELISIDNLVQDPVGTRYYNGVVPQQIGSDIRGLYIHRDTQNPGSFRLEGYSKPFYCAAEVCDPLLDSSDRKLLTSEYAFELMEIDGERVIGLIEL
jgi:hypothetical protein